MKCCYHPDQEAEGACVQCNAPLCKTCMTDAELNEGLCQVCLRQKKFIRIYSFFRLFSCSLGAGWLILAFIIFDTSQGWSKPFTYGLLGLFGSFVINMLGLFVVNWLLLSNLNPEQKLFVALSRYSVTGQKTFLTQAVRAMKKIDNLDNYRNALFDQIIAILILQPYDLPMDWVAYLSETFKMTEEDLLSGLLEFGHEVFLNNIFENHHYQAIEPYIEILNRTEQTKLYNELIDKIMARLGTVDLKAIKRSQPIQFEGMAQPQQPLRREPPSVLQDKAFLTELKLIDEELKEFLIKEKRDGDWEKISETIDQFELPKVPKNTFEAARSLATQQVSQRQAVPTTLPEELEQVKADPSKTRLCAECGASFSKEQLKKYEYKGISVNVCSHCFTILEEEGHREPKQLAKLRGTDAEG